MNDHVMNLFTFFYCYRIHHTGIDRKPDTSCQPFLMQLRHVPVVRKKLIFQLFLFHDNNKIRFLLLNILFWKYNLMNPEYRTTCISLSEYLKDAIIPDKNGYGN